MAQLLRSPLLALLLAIAPAALADDAEAAKKEQIAELSTRWSQLVEEAAHEQEGWEAEQPLAFAEWSSRTDRDFMPRTAGMFQVLRRFLADKRVSEVMKTHAADPEVKRITTEATAARDKAAANYVAGIAKLMEEAKGHTKEKPKELLQTTKYLADKVENNLPAGELREKGIGPVRALIKQIEGELKGATQAHSDLQQRCTETANAAWTEMVGEFSGFEQLDVAACVKEAEGWKGTLVRLEGFECPLRFRDDNYDYVAVIERAPVALVLDEGLKGALKAMSEATGLSIEAVEAVVAVVEGAGQVNEYRFNGDQRVVSTSYEAPRCRVVAFRSGPFAASLKSGTTNLAKVQGMPAIEVKAKGEVPSGPSQLLRTLVKVLVLLVVLAAIGGGGWFGWQQLQAKKAAAAAAEGSKEPAAPE